MPMRIPDSVQQLMAEEGLLPKQCRLIELHINPDSAIILRYEVYIDPDQFAKFARVFEALGIEATKAGS